MKKKESKNNLNSKSGNRLKEMANKMARKGDDDDEKIVEKHLNHDIKESKQSMSDDKKLKRKLKEMD